MGAQVEEKIVGGTGQGSTVQCTGIDKGRCHEARGYEFESGSTPLQGDGVLEGLVEIRIVLAPGLEEGTTETGGCFDQTTGTVSDDGRHPGIRSDPDDLIETHLVLHSTE